MFAEGGIIGIPFEVLANITRGADNVKINAGAKLNEKTVLDNIKVLSRENQDKIYES